jgi:hypothetical protein
LFPFAQLNRNNDSQALSFHSQCKISGGWESFLRTTKWGTSHSSDSSKNSDFFILHLFWFLELFCESLPHIWADTIELQRIMTSDWQFFPSIAKRLDLMECQVRLRRRRIHFGGSLSAEIWDLRSIGWILMMSPLNCDTHRHYVDCKMATERAITSSQLKISESVIC